MACRVTAPATGKGQQANGTISLGAPGSLVGKEVTSAPDQGL
jgi:hypothetical protein